MLRKTILLSLALPLALLVGCETGSSDDTTATTEALESCFSTAAGGTKCAVQPAGASFSRDDHDVDADGRSDHFVCAHIVRRAGQGAGQGPTGQGGPAVAGGAGPRGWGNDAGGADGHSRDFGGGGGDGKVRPVVGAGGASGGKGKPPLSVPADADCEHLGCVDMRAHGSRGGASGSAAAPQADDMRCPSPGAGGAAGR